MKTTMAILAVVLFAAASAPAHGDPTPGMNLKIAGSEESDEFHVSVSSDGRTYDVLSNVALEADSSICWSSEVAPKFELHCRATAIAGFEISGGGGDDSIELVRVPVPATLSGGPGNDFMSGGLAADKLLGGSGDDLIEGRAGDDLLIGEEGRDFMLGGGGADRLEGGAGHDVEFGAGGSDTLLGGAGPDRLDGGPGSDMLFGGPGSDFLEGGPGRNVVRQ